MRLYKLLENAGIDIPHDTCDTDILGIATHSDDVVKGGMFICTRGEHHDGHEFIDAAVKAGASVIVTDMKHSANVGGAATIKVDNTRCAAAHLYNAWHGDPAANMKIIAVTGTNGKTSVTYLLKQIFEEAGYRCGVIGTVECYCCGKQIATDKSGVANMTTPEPPELYRMLALMAHDGVEFVFLEATSHASVLSRLEALSFDTLIFTNLTQDHLDFHKSMDEYFAAKARLFSKCKRAVFNIDDSYALDFLKASSAEKNILCSQKNEKADYLATDVITRGADGIQYRVAEKEGSFDIDLSLAGDFVVMNSLEAIAVAREYEICQDIIFSSLKKMKTIPGRLERVELDGADFSVFVDYAHTPDALSKLLESVERFKHRGKIILLFGCGGERDIGKRRQMGRVASRYADFIILTSDNSRGEDTEKIISDIYKGINKEKEHIIIPERKKAIEFAISSASADDIVVLAGKGHEKYEICKTGRKPFDEIEIIKEAYRSRR